MHDSAKPASQSEKGTVSISFAAEGAAKTHEYQSTAGLSSGKLLDLAGFGMSGAFLPLLVRVAGSCVWLALGCLACLTSCQEVALNPGFPQFLPNFRVMWQCHPPCGTTFCTVFACGLSRQIRATIFSHLMLFVLP